MFASGREHGWEVFLHKFLQEIKDFRTILEGVVNFHVKTLQDNLKVE